MLARIALSAAFSIVVFIIPLAAHAKHLAQPAPWLGVGVAMLVLLSQPPVNLAESARSAADRGSALAIFVAMIATQLAAAISFARAPQFDAGWPLAAGTAVATFGLALRLWAIRTLGRFFTSTVRVVDGQRVVRSGPYRWLRHPSYTGALLAAFGVAVALESRIGGLLVLGLCVPAYVYRIAVEERALLAELGDAYREYRVHTWGVVPGFR